MLGGLLVQVYNFILNNQYIQTLQFSPDVYHRPPSNTFAHRNRTIYLVPTVSGNFLLSTMYCKYTRMWVLNQFFPYVSDIKAPFKKPLKWSKIFAILVYTVAQHKI